MHAIRRKFQPEFISVIQFLWQHNKNSEKSYWPLHTMQFTKQLQTSPNHTRILFTADPSRVITDSLQTACPAAPNTNDAHHALSHSLCADDDDDDDDDPSTNSFIDSVIRFASRRAPQLITTSVHSSNDILHCAPIATSKKQPRQINILPRNINWNSQLPIVVVFFFCPGPKLDRNYK